VRLSPARRAGVTLLEVLTAIFILGVGLLALLFLFPLGALAMAQAVKDDRAGKIAADAVAFSQDGLNLLSRTGEFVRDSFANNSADPKTAAALRAGYEALGMRATGLETRLRELHADVPDPAARARIDQLVLQIRAIKMYLAGLADLLRLLEGPN